MGAVCQVLLTPSEYSKLLQPGRHDSDEHAGLGIYELRLRESPGQGWFDHDSSEPTGTDKITELFELEGNPKGHPVQLLCNEQGYVQIDRVLRA